MVTLPISHYTVVVVVLVSCLFSSGCCQNRRTDISRMSGADLEQLRNNIQRLQDSGQWVDLAGDHGIPNQYCPHGNHRFLIWHRRQIARIEDLLGQKLPYWDWTRTNGVPDPCKDPTYTDASGNQRPNPLYAGPKIGGTTTTRDPLPDFNLESLRNQEQLAMSATRFEDFSQRLEGAHNDIHGDVGGDMNALDYAAFDPIFWMHHNNVDRIWYRWQRRNRFAMYPDESRGEMQDSLGVFMGEDVIQDLTGWIPSGRQPRVINDQTPTMSSTGSITGTRGSNGARSAPSPSPSGGQPQFQTLADDDHRAPPDHPTPDHSMHSVRSSNTSSNAPIGKAPVYLPSLKSNRHQLHGLQAPIEIENTIQDDPSLRTSVEMPGYQPQNRTVLMLKGIESAADPFRIDMYLSGQLIGWLQTFGMGVADMKYKMDRLVDITKHANKCGHDQIQDKLHFRVTNQRTGEVDLTKNYELGLTNIVF